MDQWPLDSYCKYDSKTDDEFGGSMITECGGDATSEVQTILVAY